MKKVDIEDLKLDTYVKYYLTRDPIICKITKHNSYTLECFYLDNSKDEFNTNTLGFDAGKLEECTQEEKDWLDACIKANKFVPKPEVTDNLCFNKGDYIVILKGDYSNFKVNYCFKQREYYEYLRPELNLLGSKTDGMPIYNANKNKYPSYDWRFASSEEITEYERQGKPFDVTKLTSTGNSNLPKYVRILNDGSHVSGLSEGTRAKLGMVYKVHPIQQKNSTYNYTITIETKDGYSTYSGDILNFYTISNEEEYRIQEMGSQPDNWCVRGSNPTTNELGKIDEKLYKAILKVFPKIGAIGFHHNMYYYKEGIKLKYASFTPIGYKEISLAEFKSRILGMSDVNEEPKSGYKFSEEAHPIDNTNYMRPFNILDYEVTTFSPGLTHQSPVLLKTKQEKNKLIIINQ